VVLHNVTVDKRRFTRQHYRLYKLDIQITCKICRNVIEVFNV